MMRRQHRGTKAEKGERERDREREREREREKERERERKAKMQNRCNKRDKVYARKCVIE